MSVKMLRFSQNIDSDIRRGWSALGGMRFDTEEEVKGFWSDYYGGNTDNIDVRYDEYQNKFAAVHHSGLSAFLIEEDGDEIADANYLRNHATLTQAESTVGKVKLLESYGDGWHLLECDGYEKESLD